MAGVMEHANEMCLITNPLVNSYKRIVPGYEAPVDVSWSPSNRSPLIRVPAARGSGTRLEFRSPDSAANPYLALAVSLAAGLDGIKRKLTPGKGSMKNQYEMAEGEKQEAGMWKLRVLNGSLIRSSYHNGKSIVIYTRSND